MATMSFGQRIDSTFAVNGKLFMSLDKKHNIVKATRYDDDNFLVLFDVGSGDSSNYDQDFALMKMDLEGSLDNNFGTNGMLRLDYQPVDYSNSKDIEITNSGDILVLGTGYDISTSEDIYTSLIKFNSIGDIDLTFADSGSYIQRLYNYKDHPNSFALDSMERIYIVGGADRPSIVGEPFIIRLDTNGTLDSTWSDEGIFDEGQFFKKPLSTNQKHATAESYYDIYLGENDIYSVGSNPLFKGSISKFNYNGVLDSLFGLNGRLDFKHPLQESNAFTSIQKLPNGDFIMEMYNNAAPTANFEYVTLYDTTFTYSSFDVNGQHDFITDVLLHNDQIYLTGRSTYFQNITPNYYSDEIAIIKKDDIGNMTDSNFGQDGIFSFQCGSAQSGANSSLIVNDTILYTFGNFIENDDSNSIIITRIILNSESTIGVEDRKNKQLFKVYPNPVNNVVYIESSFDDLEIELFDVVGKLLLTTKELFIDVNLFPSGVYFVGSNKHDRKHKVVIKH